MLLLEYYKVSIWFTCQYAVLNSVRARPFDANIAQAAYCVFVTEITASQIEMLCWVSCSRVEVVSG